MPTDQKIWELGFLMSDFTTHLYIPCSSQVFRMITVDFCTTLKTDPSLMSKLLDNRTQRSKNPNSQHSQQLNVIEIDRKIRVKPLRSFLLIFTII